MSVGAASIRVLITAALLLAASPAFAQSPTGEVPGSGEAEKKPAPVGEADTKAPEDDTNAGKAKRDKLRLKPTYKARAAAKIPELPEEEAAFKAAVTMAAGLASKAKLGETGTAQVRAVAMEFAKRKFAELTKAHADLPKRREECRKLLVSIAPDLSGKEIPAEWMNLMLEAARLRPEQLMPRRSQEDRQNAFTALAERCEAEEDAVRKAVLDMRSSLAKGDPWTVQSRLSAIDGGLNEALKLVLTPEEYFSVLEARGVIKPANYESVGTAHFTKALEPLKLDEATMGKVTGILDDKALIPELKYERIARLLGPDRDRELADALKVAQKALDKERKDAAKAKQRPNRREKEDEGKAS